DDNGDDDDDNGNNGALPNNVANYIRNNYAGYRIDNWHNEDLCDSRLVLKVELEDGPGPDLDLYFNPAGEFLFAAKEIKTSDLPSAVRNAITTNFPGYRIDDDKSERFQLSNGSFQYKVELERNSGSDIKVIFDATGALLCRKS
ncbi:MAG: PepSY-like domain-containing protein, partial [Saprospiraceae bacterium]